MITRRELAARAVALDASDDLRAAINRAEIALTGLCLSPHHARRVWLKNGDRPAWVGPAVLVAERDLTDRGGALIERLMLEPVRLYELVDEPPHRTLAVVGAFLDGAEQAVMAVGRLRVKQKGNRVLESGPFEIELCVLAQAEATRAILERLALELQPNELKRTFDDIEQPHRAMVLGGGRGTPRAKWRRELGAVLWPFGVELGDFFEEPWRRIGSIERKLGAAGDDVYVLLRSWLIDARGEDHTDTFAQRLERRLVVDTGTADNLPEALAQVRQALSQHALDEPASRPRPASTPAGASEGGDFRPATWAEFHSNLWRLTSNVFVLTARAKASCRLNPYPHPGKMWDDLARLAEAAEAWAASNCSVGQSFAAWARELNGVSIAMGDRTIADGKAATFVHDGVTLSRLPHVQVDQARAFTDLGRIHFALDSDNGRIVVDHIGLKLLGRKAAT